MKYPIDKNKLMKNVANQTESAELFPAELMGKIVDEINAAYDKGVEDGMRFMSESFVSEKGAEN